MPAIDPINDGDVFFTGVNSRLDPGQLQPGFCFSAKNKRFENGVAATRPGIRKMPWSNKGYSHYESKAYAKNDIVKFSGQKNTDGTISYTGDLQVTPAGSSTVTFQSIVLCIGESSTYTDVTVSSVGSTLPSGTTITLDGGRKFVTSQSAATGDTTISGTVSGGTIQIGDSGFASGTGPASQIQAFGPYFKRVNSSGNDYTGTHVPLTNSTTVNSDYWVDLGHAIMGYGDVYGCGIFRDPNSVEYLLIAASDGVYLTREGGVAKKVATLVIDEDVTFVQCFNVVVMMRGVAKEPLVMKNIDDGFVSITQEDTDTSLSENETGDGTTEIPNSDHALFFGNRLLVPHNRDMVAVSDYLNYTRYGEILSTFRINQGSEDELVALQRINSTTLAAFKNNSIYIVSNLYGSLSDAILDEVSREFGAVSFKSTIQVGSDVWFLSSKRGVCSLQVAQNGKVNAVQVPVSEPIQPLIERINWNYADKAVAATYGNRVYFAVPLDNNSFNSAILVYDLLQSSWSGFDEQADVINVKEFVEMEYQGKRRLFFLSADGFINLYDDNLTECGFVDEKATSTDINSNSFGQITKVAISDEIITRGYTANDISVKKWRSADVQLATSNPNFTVDVIYDGPEEDDQRLTLDANGDASSKTFNREIYDKPFDAPNFDASMQNNDALVKYRQDYSVDPSTPIHANFNTTFDPDLHQTSVNKYRFRGSGRYVQLKVANTQGRVEVKSTKVGALGGESLTRKET